jgi:hypothetical protein
MKQNLKAKIRMAMAAVMLACLGAVTGCGQIDSILHPQNEGLCIVSWNVQNLMDGSVQGTEHAEFQQEGAWDESAYKDRLRTIAAVILKMNPAPDLIVFEEVENDGVLGDLCRSHLGRHGYRWYGATSDLGNAIQIGFVSRIEVAPDDVRIIGVPGQRSILQIGIGTDEGYAVVFGLHAKSRIGGAEATEPARVRTAKVLLEAARAAMLSFPGAVIVAAGDFNEDLDSDGGQALCDAGRNPDDGVIRITGSRGADFWPAETWYSFWEDSQVPKSRLGSYCYKGQWDRFDAILCSKEGFDGTGLDVEDGGVHSRWMLCDGSGEPSRYSIKMRSGVSDHLPVWLMLK